MKILPLTLDTHTCVMGYCDQPAVYFYDLKSYGLRAFCEECGQIMDHCSKGNLGVFSKKQRISLADYDTALIAKVMED